MFTAIVILLALILAELAVLIVVSLRDNSPGARPSEAGVRLPAPAPTSEQTDRKAEDLEKLRQEAINNILGYDITTARKAVNRSTETE